jgi:hypothetical protein
VKNALSVDDFGLLNLFGTIPVQRDEDVPWVYNDSAYEITKGQTEMSFAVAPADRDVRIRLRVNGLLLYELNAMGIDDLKLNSEKGREWLEVIISQQQYIRLRAAPEISISERLGDLT